MNVIKHQVSIAVNGLILSAFATQNTTRNVFFRLNRATWAFGVGDFLTTKITKLHEKEGGVWEVREELYNHR